MSKTFLLIDGMNMFFRGAYTVSPTAPIDMIVGMSLHTVLNCMRKAWRKFDGEHAVLCLEGKSWRKGFYPSYKLKREIARKAKSQTEKENDQLMLEAFGELCTFISEKTNTTVLRHSKAEADDMIALFIQSHPNDKHVIVSTDTDFIQLLKHKNVTIYNGVQDIYMTHEGVFDNKDNKLSFEFKSDGKLKLGKPDPNFVSMDKWYEYVTFIKIIRGDTSDNIFSAYPGCRLRGTKNRIGITEAFNDRESRGFIWNNFMQQRWEDVDNVEHKVRDKYELNKLLIDLEQQPEDIKIGCITAIHEATGKQVPTQQIGFSFMKFCGSWDLKQIANYPQDFLDIFAKRYN